MDKRKLSFLAGACGLLVVAGFALWASQLLPVSAVNQGLPVAIADSLGQQQQQAIPTPRGAITRLPNMPGPGFGSPGRPTAIPATRVRLGQVKEIQPQDMLPQLDRTLAAIPGKPSTDKYPVVTQDSTRRYQVRSGRERYDTYQRTFVDDLQSGQTKQLGDDRGSGYPVAMTDQYLLWSFRCYDNCETSSPTNGLYMYDLRSGANDLLTEDIAKRDYKADGRWIGYVKIKDTRVCYGDLYVMNVDTKQERFVDASVPWECAGEKGYFALSNNRLVWARANAFGLGKWGFGLLDLGTGQQRNLPAPGSAKPNHLSFSGDYILMGLFGYDLRQDVLFNISIIPPGWEKVVFQGSISPVVKDDRVYWGQGVAGQIHYFVAPLVRVTNAYPAP